MSRANPYVPIGVTQQGRLVPTIESAMDSRIEPWHMPHFRYGGGHGLTEVHLDLIQQERELRNVPLHELLLAKGSMTGPYRTAHPARNRPVRRFFRAVLAFLLAPRPYL